MLKSRRQARRDEKRREKQMFLKVKAENDHQTSGRATEERVSAAMPFIMGDSKTTNNEIATVLKQMLGKEPLYESKIAMFDEALNRLYPCEPSDSSDSDSTIVVDVESDETIVADLD